MVMGRLAGRCRRRCSASATSQPLDCRSLPRRDARRNVGRRPSGLSGRRQPGRPRQEATRSVPTWCRQNPPRCGPRHGGGCQRPQRLLHHRPRAARRTRPRRAGEPSRRAPGQAPSADTAHPRRDRLSPLDQVATSFLFKLVSKRYTRGSIIVTSNKSYSEWGAVFGDEVAAAAIIDRLLHYSTTVNIRGESYRLKDKKRAGVFSMPTSTLGTTAPQVGNLRPALRRNRS